MQRGQHRHGKATRRCSGIAAPARCRGQQSRQQRISLSSDGGDSCDLMPFMIWRGRAERGLGALRAPLLDSILHVGEVAAGGEHEGSLLGIQSTASLNKQTMP